MRAVFVKTLINVKPGTQLLWQVVDDNDTAAFSTHVVTSSVNWVFARETMAFWANADGDIVDWGDLACTGPGEHVACLKAAGFEVVEHD